MTGRGARPDFAARRIVTGLFVATVALWVPRAAIAQTKPAAGAASANFYSCTDATGRMLTSDRPIAQCAGRDQRVLGADGSQRGTLPPALSIEEQAQRDERDRREQLAREAREREVRRDRLLLARYPDPTSHDRVRAAALATPQAVIRASETRIAELALDRRKLANEAEFYVGKPLPVTLADQIEVNEAAAASQRTAIDNQHAEIDRINRLYDEELARLRMLWGRKAADASAPTLR